METSEHEQAEKDVLLDCVQAVHDVMFVEGTTPEAVDEDAHVQQMLIHHAGLNRYVRVTIQACAMEV